MENGILPYRTEICGDRWFFQQDNASIHRAGDTMKWFEENNIEVLDWPALSPDLNPIENIWGILVRQVYKDGRQFDNINDLKIAIKQEWNNIDVNILKNLVFSMPNRIFEVIQKNRGYSGY